MGTKGHKSKPVWEEPRLQAEEIVELARGIFTGEVFTSGHLPEHDQHLLPCVFMPLGFFSNEQRKEFVAHPPELLCGWLKDALPRSINGYPFLPKMQMVYAKDAALIWKGVKSLEMAAAQMGKELRVEIERNSDAA
jgi:hypothetical protein